MAQPATGKGKQREPPPALFLHPSPAASHVSLPGILAPGVPGSSAASGAGLASQAPATLQYATSLLRQESVAGLSSPAESRHPSLRTPGATGPETGLPAPLPL